MMQSFGVPAAGRQINTVANFFRYESAIGAGADETIRVRADGNDLGTYLPGDSIKLPVTAKCWDIAPLSPTVTCTVRLGIGRVESSRLVGNVKVIDQIASNVVQTGSSAPALLAVQAFTAYTILGPASNQRGAVVRMLSIGVQSGVGGSVNSRILCAPAAPSSPDGNQFAFAISGDISNTFVDVSLYDIKKGIPPGWGLYFFTAVGAVAAVVNGYAIAYELL